MRIDKNQMRGLKVNPRTTHSHNGSGVEYKGELFKKAQKFGTLDKSKIKIKRKG